MKTIAERTIHCRAPAKVNLTLAVLGRRPDGFHDIESWVVPIAWFDEITLKPAERISLDVIGHCDSLRADKTNLIWRAAGALAEAAGRQEGAAITLEKRIPVGAGLGGGSSDAATTLLGLNTLWGLNWPEERLAPIAAALGSDVPFFLEPGPAVIRGRGQRVERLGSYWQGWLALVAPRFGVSTASVYRHWSEAQSPQRSASAPWRDPTIDARALSLKLFNDLEAAAHACEPRLRQLHALLDGLDDGRAVRMTGSGTCLFTVFDTQEEAIAWTDRVPADVRDACELFIGPTS